jgi:hypothetical protein
MHGQQTIKKCNNKDQTRNLGRCFDKVKYEWFKQTKAMPLLYYKYQMVMGYHRDNLA